MKKNKITRCKVWFAAALLMFVAVMAPMSSYAAGEYTVSGTFKKGLSGVNFELYKVGQFEGSNLKLNFSAPVDRRSRRRTSALIRIGRRHGLIRQRSSRIICPRAQLLPARARRMPTEHSLSHRR